ncbi:MAG: YkgJ family cysteine cluster protein, partial [Halobacteriota archaeon]
MEVNCEGCAGCCVDWRPIAPNRLGHEWRGPHRPVDDVYNLVPLTRDEIRAFLDAGFGDVLTPRLWYAEPNDEAVELGGERIAAIDGHPVFFVGLRKPPKPVAPFGTERTWLRACVFLDPETLQCRIHGSDLYPTECREYPGHNLALETETECERVESTFGGERLVDDGVPDAIGGLLLGQQALGSKVFAHPDPTALDGVVERAKAGALTATDRAEFVGAALGSSPRSL